MSAMRATALVTRPRDDAGPLVQALAARGFGALVEPLIDIRLQDGEPISLEGVQGLLATSANGVRALARRSDERRLPLWAVGDATARCAGDLGFVSISSAGGDVAALAALVERSAVAAAGPLVHVAGSETAGDLAGRLGSRGFAVRRLVLYKAVPVEAFSPGLRAALAERRLGLGLFFSPRTARCFARLAVAEEAREGCAAMVAYGLSDAVAAELRELPWRRLVVAGQPTQSALLDCIEADWGEQPC
jgi:uroporphyrinogen-III synthase